MIDLTSATVSSYPLTRWVLSPLDLPYLSTASFILVIAVPTRLDELLVRPPRRGTAS